LKDKNGRTFLRNVRHLAVIRPRQETLKITKEDYEELLSQNNDIKPAK